MPFYEYQCRSCGAQVEVLQKITDAPLKKCPECGKSQLSKLVSAPVFRLKGGGWYETDFKTDNDRKRNLVGDEPAEKKSDDKAETKADAKAEAKPEAKSDAKSSEAKPAAKPVKASGSKARAAARPKSKAKAKGRR